MQPFIDLHNHTAWDIDDGIPSLEEAREALEIAQKDGITTIASTPHLIYGVSDINELARRQGDLKALAQEYGIRIVSGAELFLNNSSPQAIATGFVRPYENTRYQLCEFDVRRDIHTLPYHEDALYELTVRKLVPLIAHIERYFHNGLDLDLIRSWKEQGYVLQINRTSLMAPHSYAGKNAWKLLEEGLCDVVATDTHATTGPRVTVLSDAHEAIAKKFGTEMADLLCKENPARLLADQPPISPQPIKKKKWFGLF